MRALVTGAAGFLGRHLVVDLAAAGAAVVTLTRSGACDVHGVARTFRGDVTDVEFVERMVAECEPTHVFHLAGVLGSPGVTAETLMCNNVVGTAVLLDALVRTRRQPVVVLTGSSAIYGDPERQPITEDAPFRPRTDYAASKVAQEMIGISRYLAHDLPVIRTRAFNMIGPGQPESLVASRIARQIAMAEVGGDPVVHLRSVGGRRDFVDVRDVARACALLARQGTAGEVYNICSARSRSVTDALDVLQRCSLVPIRVEVNTRAEESGNVSEQIGCYERLAHTTGWQPRVPFEDSLRDLLDDWRMKEKR